MVTILPPTLPVDELAELLDDVLDEELLEEVLLVEELLDELLDEVLLLEEVELEEEPGCDSPPHAPSTAVKIATQAILPGLRKVLVNFISVHSL